MYESILLLSGTWNWKIKVISPASDTSPGIRNSAVKKRKWHISCNTTSSLRSSYHILREIGRPSIWFSFHADKRRFIEVGSQLLKLSVWDRRLQVLTPSDFHFHVYTEVMYVYEQDDIRHHEVSYWQKDV